LWLFAQFLETLLRVSFTKVDLNKNGTVDKSELATLIAIMAAREESQVLVQALKLTIERELGSQEIKADFARFADVAIGLLANSIRCHQKEAKESKGETKSSQAAAVHFGSVISVADDASGAFMQALPQPVINLLNFAVNADEWEQLTGKSLAEAAAADKKDSEEKDMQRRINEAMEAALKAEADAKAKREKEEKEAKDKQAASDGGIIMLDDLAAPRGPGRFVTGKRPRGRPMRQHSEIDFLDDLDRCVPVLPISCVIR
jgi:hypothetical protein